MDAFWITIDQASLSASVNTTGLESILRDGGITINQDLVADPIASTPVFFNTGQGFGVNLPYPFWMQTAVRPHVLAGNISQVTTAWASSLSFEEDEQKQLLLSTTDQAVHQTTSFAAQPDSPLNGLTPNRFGLAATVQDIANTSGGDAGDGLSLQVIIS